MSDEHVTPATAALQKTRSLALQLAVLLIIAISAFAFVGWVVTTSLGRSERAGGERRDIAVAQFCAEELAAGRADLLGDVISGAVTRDRKMLEDATERLGKLRGALTLCERKLPPDARDRLADVKRQLAPYIQSKGTP